MTLTPMARPYGLRVRQLRLRKGWTQAELGRRIRRTQGAISQVESGKTVSHTLMRQVARSLRVEFSEIAELAVPAEEDLQDKPLQRAG